MVEAAVGDLFRLAMDSCLSDADRLTKIQLVKTYLKILGAIVSVAVLWLGYSFVLFHRDEDLRCDTVTVTGKISPETFVKLRGCLARSLEPKKTFVITSEGGDNFAALALGILIHRHNWDVEIVDYCASACANFIFPAGKTKYLNRHSMLLFHGGPYQENLLEMAKMFKPVESMSEAPAEPVTLGQVDKENTFSTTPTKSIAYKELHKFLSIPDASTPVDIVVALRKASDQFYQDLGINPLLSTYGQLGAYEPTYRSYKYGGFIYGLDSLRRFGIGNIELKEGEWHPVPHPAFPEVYEVTYP